MKSALRVFVLIKLGWILTGCGVETDWKQRHYVEVKTITSDLAYINICMKDYGDPVDATIDKEKKIIYLPTTHRTGHCHTYILFSDCSNSYDRSQYEDAHTRTEIALTRSSFDKAVLCYGPPSGDKAVVSLLKPGESCPQGTIQQTAPVDNCSQM